MDIDIKNVLERLGNGILVGAVQLRREESIQIVRYIDDLQKRIESLKIKVEGDANLPKEMIYLRDEQNNRFIQGTEYIEFSRHYILPINTSIREAYAYIIAQGLKNNHKRIYPYQEGYVAVEIDELVRKDGKIEAGEMQLLDDVIKNMPVI